MITIARHRRTALDTHYYVFNSIYFHLEHCYFDGMAMPFFRWFPFRNKINKCRSLRATAYTGSTSRKLSKRKFYNRTREKKKK